MNEQTQNSETNQSTLRFYASIALKRAIPIVFFTILALALSFVAIQNPNSTTLFTFLVSVLFLWGGVWLEWRRGWPKALHGPVCELNAAGIIFWPNRSSRQFLPWNDLNNVIYDMSDDSIIFETKNPDIYDRRYLVFLKRPPYVANGVKSSDHEYLVNVLHRYWDEDKKTSLGPA